MLLTKWTIQGKLEEAGLLLATGVSSDASQDIDLLDIAMVNGEE